MFPQNHTSVWGSYWEDGKWGFKCCQQFVRNSYCTGSTNIELRRQAKMAASGEQQQGADEQQAADQASEEKTFAKPAAVPRKGTSYKTTELEDQVLDKEKMSAALRAEEQRLRGDHADDRKRKYNSMSGASDQVTAEELEAYRLKRANAEDPMANFKDDDE